MGLGWVLAAGQIVGSLCTSIMIFIYMYIYIYTYIYIDINIIYFFCALTLGWPITIRKNAKQVWVNYYLTSSDPHLDTLFWPGFWHIIWKFLLHIYIYSDIFSGICSDILSNNRSSILSDIYSDILSGMCSGPVVLHCIRSSRYGSQQNSELGRAARGAYQE